MYSPILFAVASFCLAVATPTSRETIKSLYNITFFTLDVDDDEGPYTTIETEVDGMPSIMYFPKRGHVIEKICQGDIEIWTAEGNELCFNPIMIIIDDKPCYMVILSQSRAGHNLYVKKNTGDRWIESETDYGTIVDSLKIKVNERIQMDSAGDNRCSIFSADYMLIVVPRTGYVANGVVHNGSYVWNATAGENCIFSTVNYEGERAVSIRIFVRSQSTVLSHYLFMNLNGTWLFIDRYDYKKRANFMDVKGFNPFILDISTPRESAVRVHAYEYNAVVYRLLAPKMTSFFSAIADNSAIIWRGTNGEKATEVWVYTIGRYSLCRINLVNISNVSKSLFFENRRGIWSVMIFSDFLSRLDGITRLNSDHIRLDGSAVCPDTCNLMEYVEHGFLTKIIIPVWNYRISSIYYGKDLIWKSKNGQESTLVNFFIKEEKKFCFIMIRDKGDIFFEYDGIKWNKVSSDSFFDFYDDPSKALESDVVGDLVIDIAKKGDPILKTVENMLFGILIHKYSPPPDMRVSEIVDGEESIWKAQSRHERSLLCEIYSKDNISMAAIHNKMDEHFESSYYCKNGGRWNPIEKKRFDRLIKRLLEDISPDSDDSGVKMNGGMDGQNGSPWNGDQNGSGGKMDVQNGDRREPWMMECPNGSTVGKMGDCNDHYDHSIQSQECPDDESSGGRMDNQGETIMTTMDVHESGEATGGLSGRYPEEPEEEDDSVDIMEGIYKLPDTGELEPLITLDISSRESGEWAERIDARIIGSPYLIFNSRVNIGIKKIVDGPTIIWNGGDGKKCHSISFLMVNNKAILAEVLVNSGSTSVREYLERKLHGWTNISVIKYESKLARYTYSKVADGALFATSTCTLFLAILAMAFNC